MKYNYEKTYDVLMGECKQYISDLTEEECGDAMENYYGDEAPIELPIEDVTPETPCGSYVSYKA